MFVSKDNILVLAPSYRVYPNTPSSSSFDRRDVVRRGHTEASQVVNATSKEPKGRTVYVLGIHDDLQVRIYLIWDNCTFVLESYPPL